MIIILVFSKSLICDSVNASIKTETKNTVFLMTIFIRAVTKISSCLANTTSTFKKGIKQLAISFGSTVFLFFFPMKVAESHVHSSWGKFPAPSSS